MSEAVRSRIFEPYFTTKSSEGGTGLGLATVYGIVGQSGGFVEVYSEPGNGTTMKIYLPEAITTAQESTAESRVRPEGTETIVLVDDNDAVREMCRDALVRSGYTVYDAGTAAPAREFVSGARGRIDLLITDLVLPGVTGGELARANCPGAQVLFMSGYTEESSIAQGLNEAGSSYLQKPFGVGQLAETVRRVLDSAAQ